jgi:hypothetical protein
VAKDKGKRRLTQSRSVAGFKLFTLERRTDDDLPQHIKGVAVWKEIEDEEGYWVFDILSNTYLAIEYEEATRQWYFIQQDSRTNNISNSAFEFRCFCRFWGFSGLGKPA